MNISFKIAVFTIVSSFIGIIIGWILKEYSGHLDTKQKNKRQYKKVLFNLMRIRNYVTLSHLDEIKDKIAEVGSKGLPDSDQLKAKDLLLWIMDRFDKDFLNKKIKTDIEEMQKIYSDTIQILSEIDPLLAYELVDKSNLPDYFIDFDTWRDDFSKIEDKQIIQKYLNDIKFNLQESKKDETIIDLENDILYVASLIDKKTKIFLEASFNEFHASDYFMRNSENLNKDIEEYAKDDLPF